MKVGRKRNDFFLKGRGVKVKVDGLLRGEIFEAEERKEEEDGD